MKKTLALLALAGSLSLAPLAADTVKPDTSGTGSVSAAIKATEDALKALGTVKVDLGDHGAAASAALNTALLELKAGLADAKAGRVQRKPENSPKAPDPATAPIAPGASAASISGPAPAPVATLVPPSANAPAK
jgi:hypothetical protein